MNNQKNAMAEYTGVFLPKEILSLKDLNLTEKLLLAQIIPLCVSEPCYASNQFFAERLGITETTVSTTLKSLDDKGYIQTFLDRKAGNKRTIEIFYFDNTLFKIFKDPSLKTLNTLFKNLKDPLKNSYIPYLKNLKTLFKNFNFIYKDESKEESKEESKDYSICENFSNFTKSQNEENENKIEFVEAIYESEIDDSKKEKEKSSAKKEKEKIPHPSDANKNYGEWIEGHGDGELQTLLSEYYLKNKELYEPEMYKEFKAYWTALTQKGKTKGKELWRTKETFSIAGRLATWSKGYNQQKNVKFSNNRQKRTIQEELAELNNTFEEHQCIRRMLAEQEYDPTCDFI